VSDPLGFKELRELNDQFNTDRSEVKKREEVSTFDNAKKMGKIQLWKILK